MNITLGLDEKIEALREDIKRVMEREKMTMAAAAKLAGLGSSTLSAFMAGTYNGNNEQMAEKLRTWLTALEMMGKTRQAASSEIVFTLTKSTTTFLSALEYAQSMADVAVVAGGAGVGKTMAAKNYAANHPNVWMITAEPSLASAYALLDYVADALSVPETAAQKRSRAIASRLRGTAGLLIVDEAQHLTVGAIEQLRSIHDRAEIGLALMGNEDVWSRVDGGGRKAQFAQLFSRVGARVTALRPTASDIEDLLNSAGIEDKQVRGLLRAIAVKPGALRGMVKTLRMARMLASGSNEPVSAVHVTAAWNRLEGRDAP